MLKGNNLVMPIKTPTPKVKVFQWRSKIRAREYSLITYIPNAIPINNFGERAEFSTTNYSLRLKNLALNQSGLYQAVEVSKEVGIIADYHVTVQGMFPETKYRHLMQAVSLFVF